MFREHKDTAIDTVKLSSVGSDARQSLADDLNLREFLTMQCPHSSVGRIGSQTLVALGLRKVMERCQVQVDKFFTRPL